MQSEESSIERLKRNLYSRNEKLVPKEKRTPVGPHDSDTPTNWGESPSFDVSLEDMTKKNNSFFNKFLLGSLLFFFISLGAALFIFFGGINMISSNNLDVKIVAPSSVSSGEELLISLSIVNTNRTDLEGATLFIDYPSGSQSVGEDSKSLSHEKVDLGTIVKGGNSDYTARTLLFGEKDSVKTFIFRIEYKVKGSNAVFSKEKTYDVLIGSSPVLLKVDYPKEINSGQTVVLSIDITSNSAVPLKNSLIKIEYPYGFTYKESNMTPLRDNSVWNIGDLKNGDKKTLVVKGILVGQNLEDRSFRISSGVESSTNSKDFDVPLSDSVVTVGIRKSFFDLSIFSQGAGVGRVGDTIPIDVKFYNTLPDKILNSHIEILLGGNALDRNRVGTSNGGFFQSVNNTILWDKNTTNPLTSISPGDSGQVSFSVASISNAVQARQIKNPHIDVHVTMTGDRGGTDSASISSTEDFTIKISTQVSLTARTFRDIGPFTNTGSIPPKADKESTYTVTWTLTNTTNDLKDAVVTTSLPPGVTWKGETSPGGESITYNPDTKTVSWNVGNASSGVGFTSSPKEVSFKIGFTPSLSQVGSAPALTSSSEISATDIYTEKQIITAVQPVTTQFSDPSFTSGKETVTK